MTMLDKPVIKLIFGERCHRKDYALRMNIAGIGPIFRFSLGEAMRREREEESLTITPSRDIDSGRASSNENRRNSRGKQSLALRNDDAVVIEIKARETQQQNLPVSSTTGQNSERDAKRQQEKAVEDQIQDVIADLKKRDREVRTHEQAHKAVLGQYAAGGIQYEFTTGPDGNKYAIGGSVAVNLSEEAKPEETVRKMQTIRRAALAPQDPSSADRQVAGQASQLEARARTELREENQAEIEEKREDEEKDESSLFGLIPVNQSNSTRAPSNALAVYERALEPFNEAQPFATA